MKRVRKLLLGCLLAASLTLGGSALAWQTPPPGKTKTATKAPEAPPPTDKEIADAKAKGLVWVNTSTKVYHKDGQFYGKTKQGKFLTEAEAQKAGYRLAKDPGTSTKKPATGKK